MAGCLTNLTGSVCQPLNMFNLGSRKGNCTPPIGKDTKRRESKFLKFTTKFIIVGLLFSYSSYVNLISDSDSEDSTYDDDLQKAIQ